MAPPRAVKYRNPLRGLSNLSPARVDQGVDYFGRGPIYALGPGRVWLVIPHYSGWGATCSSYESAAVFYTITAGPLRGRSVYVTECFRPTVHMGQRVDSGTVLGTLYGEGIETGFGQQGVNQALAHLSQYGGYTEGEHTAIGQAFSNIIKSLGGPPGSNASSAYSGKVPPWLSPYLAGAPLSGTAGAHARGPSGRPIRTSGTGANQAKCQGLANAELGHKGSLSIKDITGFVTRHPECAQYITGGLPGSCEQHKQQQAASFVSHIPIVGAVVGTATGVASFLAHLPAYLKIAAGGAAMLGGLAVVMVSAGGNAEKAGAVLAAAPGVRRVAEPVRAAGARRRAITAERATQRTRSAAKEAEQRVSYRPTKRGERLVTTSRRQLRRETVRPAESEAAAARREAVRNRAPGNRKILAPPTRHRPKVEA